MGSEARRGGGMAGGSANAQQMGFVFNQWTPEFQQRLVGSGHRLVGLRHRSRTAPLLRPEPRKIMEKPHARPPGRLRSLGTPAQQEIGSDHGITSQLEFNGGRVFQPASRRGRPAFVKGLRRGEQECPPSFFKSVKICVICGLFLPPLSVLGDLCESQILFAKRSCSCAAGSSD